MNYIVADDGIEVAGTFIVKPTIRHVITEDQFGFPIHKVVVQPAPWRLLRIDQPLRLRSTPTGIEPDGWMTRRRARRRPRPPSAPTTSSRPRGIAPASSASPSRAPAWNGQDKPGNVTITGRAA